MVVYISTKFHENILHGIKVIERTQFPSEKFKRAIILKNSWEKFKRAIILKNSWEKFQRGIVP